LKISAPAPTIGLALGSGASRGWSHIGILRALDEAGIRPDIICGTSVGAMIGGAWLTGRLDALEEWVRGSTRTDVLRFFDLKFSQSGFVNTERLKNFLHDYVVAEDCRIETFGNRFLAVATELETGHEVWLQEGSMAEAIRASMAMPGLFAAVRDGDRWLVDGGLVNPVPVSACRALGADVVIGVNLNSDIIGKWRKRAEAAAEREAVGLLGSFKKQAREYRSSLFPGSGDKDAPPGLLYGVSSAIYIFQDRITRSRLEADPADVIIEPKVGDIGLLEFHRAADAIAIGEEAVDLVIDELSRLLETRRSA
jgi:NTE family protein